MRTVKTASDNHAIQVVSKTDGHLTIHKHIGTYVTDLEKERLLVKAREYILAEFDRVNAQRTKLFSDIPATWSLGEVEIINSQPLYLYNLLVAVYDKLGFGGDPLIRDLVVSRLYYPSSKRETDEILNDIFDRPYSLRTIYRHLKVAISKGLKDQYQQALINYA